MRALDDPNSTISAFLREHLPNTDLCLHVWRRDLQRHSKRYQSALGITGSIIGRAIEMRIPQRPSRRRACHRGRTRAVQAGNR